MVERTNVDLTGTVRKRLMPTICVHLEIFNKILAFFLCADLQMNSVIHVILFQNQTPRSLVAMFLLLGLLSYLGTLFLGGFYILFLFYSNFSPVHCC